SFPGTILAGDYQQFKGVSGGMTVNVFLTPAHKAEGPAYADTAARELEYFASLYGPAPSRTLNLVELPTDTVPSAWAPEIAVISDAVFDRTLRTFAQQYAGKTVTADDFRKLAEATSGQKLTAFFTQWLDSTGAPEFKNKYTIYRLGNNKGFRVSGQISQDLDLFRMPVELKIDTDGKTETKRIDVVGTDSAFSVDTFGRPRRIVIDPDNHLLKNSADTRLRAGIQRGQALVQQGDMAGALSEFNKALDINKNSSLAHYRVAEVFFLQHNYQASANAYRDCLNGDGEPRWTEVWSHIGLGKIFDTTGQRERATNEYRQALQTNDNTQGALDEAR